MDSYTFTIDNELKLTSWDRNLELLHLKTTDEVRGIPYFEILPRISQGGNDVLAEVLKSGKPQCLTGFRIYCFSTFSEADVFITPLKDELSRVVGAEVKVELQSGCALAQELLSSKTIISIGKESITLAHGVRNPLNAIKGAVVYLKECHESDTTFMEFSHIIEEEIAKLEKFITEFLSTSHQKNDVSKVAVNSILDKIVKLTSLQARNQNIQIICDYGAIPPIRIHLFQFEHAIMNLINNALEVTAQGGVITLRTATSQWNGGDCIVIEIIDSGPGMTKNKVREILTPLKPAANEKGKGYGLFITREIVQHHGGHLEIMSDRNIGTTMRIYLPVDSHQAANHG